MNATPRYSVVVPCYRSAATIGDLVNRIDRVLSRRGPYEIILVHDASPDDTWAEIERLAARNPSVQGYDLMFNAGQFRATLCGIDQAQGQYVCTMDDDLQHPPEELPKLLDLLEQHPGVDCVIGAYQNKKHEGWRNLGSRLYAQLAKRLYNKPVHLEMTSFRAMRRPLAKLLNQHRSAKPMIEILILRSTKRILNVPVEHHPRTVGRSGYDLSRLIRIVLDNVISTSTLPFQLFGAIGLALLAVSLFGVVTMPCWTIAGMAISGAYWLTLMMMAATGLVTLAVSVLGEYMGRIIEELSSAPKYVVRQSTRSQHRPEPTPT
jgi:dolichol-phosphate mannosyltransferase/undecaprenyl-phosphate 4-deoxy-4-formamido-L-arabinose transferase